MFEQLPPTVFYNVFIKPNQSLGDTDCECGYAHATLLSAAAAWICVSRDGVDVRTAAIVQIDPNGRKTVTWRADPYAYTAGEIWARTPALTAPAES